MSDLFKPKNLVLFKKAPALVEQVGDKIVIQRAGGKQVKVRPKDIELLHEGPITGLHELDTEPAGNIEEAWELLQGETVSLTELAELIYGEETPATVWFAWQALQENLYFSGTMESVTAQPEAEVAETLAKRRAKAEEAARWTAYLERVKTAAVEPEDFEHLSEVERLAYGRAVTNRTLKELGIEVRPEKAHRLLLQLKIWNETVNPYPAREGCALAEPGLAIPTLPDEEREDLTALASYAIDDDNCSDPDDAISLDGDAIWVHVADAAALIAPESELDVEARARGANLYLPETVIHMLPEGVTEILGLGLAEKSPALSFKITCDDAGTPRCEKMVPSWVAVERLSYAEVDARMEEAPFADLLKFTEKYRARRVAHGATVIDLPEVKLSASVEGGLYNLMGEHALERREAADYSVSVKDLPRLKSRDLVTDAMLMAGEAIALFLMEHEIPAPFASQPPPDEPSTPETMAEKFAYRKKFKRSSLSLEPGLHAGLGIETYTRVTSPLRRYSDLLVHQQLRAWLRGEALISEADMLSRTAQADVGGGSTARAERSSNRHWTLLHMQQQPEKVYRGVLVDKRDDRGTVLIPELAIDAKLRRMDKVELDEEVLVQLTRVDLSDLSFSCRRVMPEREESGAAESE
ncbi:RNB domain-containing ribonuclease [Pontiella agarivorans]|uniref:RNB domain-containing ribonuclease n=1 Tax=Pontiella agarivorans TaxID=3038953 RepID=A0ABU5N1G3_9BACT|nr:RNB domain-containing ribonuclease [Pontiella agarivorans]MDZ8120294.1 RNB domain-containing ribonuclease [Pontiella agarivorans]